MSMLVVVNAFANLYLAFECVYVVVQAPNAQEL